MKTFILSIPKGVPTAIMILIILYCTLADNPFGLNALRGYPYAEQIGHFILYFIACMVFIFDYAKARLPHHSKINQEIGISVSTAVLSLLMEILLMQITGYNYDLRNVYAACLASLLAFLFYHFWLLHPFRHYLYQYIQHHWRYQHRRKKK